MTRLTILLAILAFAGVANAHMIMRSPVPRTSKYGPWPEYTFDYSLSSPLGPEKPYPCAGKPKTQNTATLHAGQDFSVSWEGSAVHGGGHCQLAVSYDNAKTFVVISTILGDCLTRGLEYTFRVPSDLPAASSAIFAWTWLNRIGNREYYMNCADVRIVSNTCGPFTAPRLFVANIPPSNFQLPEWDESNDYRSVLLNNRPATTVYGDNCGGAPPPAPPPPPPPPPGPKKTTKKVIRKTTKKGPVPTNANPGACTAANNGAQVCPRANSPTFAWCVNGKWIPQACAAGTVCKATSRCTVVCDWAK